jgi:CheY-like chemotaxis protein
MKTDSIAFSGALTAARSSRRALVADDCPVVRKAHSKMLERLGFDIVSVKDGSQALGALAQISFDVVLMDCEMPIMDGLTATRTLRAMEQSSAKWTTIIGVTSCGKRDECVEAGMNAFLPKPLHIDSLAITLRGLLPQIHLHGFCSDEQLIAAS